MDPGVSTPTMAPWTPKSSSDQFREDAEDAETSIGSCVMAALTRPEAIAATLTAAMAIDPAITAASLLIGNESRLRVAGATSTTTSPDTATGPGTGRTDARRRRGDAPPTYRSLPRGVVAALHATCTTLLTDGAAVFITTTSELPPAPAVLVSRLSVPGATFGLLVVSLDGDLPVERHTALAVLARQTALTLDRLLVLERFKVLVEHSYDASFLTATDGTIWFANHAAQRLLGCPAATVIGGNLRELLHPDDATALFPSHSRRAGNQAIRLCRVRGQNSDEWKLVETTIASVMERDGSAGLVVNARDVTDRQRLEVELRHAQKLESVGRLAAGIAHEINTPIQFIGDNVRFLQHAFTDLLRLRGQSPVDDDLELIIEEIPEALTQTLEGIDQVATIVRAMKAFGHPSSSEKVPTDLNRAITNTLIVANNELKYVAMVETDLGQLPPVHCHPSDINQVILNLVINAAHAIAAVAARPAAGAVGAVGADSRGTIRVTTRQEGADAVIEIADSGIGIDTDISDKIFDPFFTTKGVGVGTGQGLALARSLVVDRHGGQITFSSVPGRGTTFTIRLPIDDPSTAAIVDIDEDWTFEGQSP